MQHSKGITVGTYTVKTKKKVNSLPICPTCKKCKDRSVCSNRKKLTKCSICKNCSDKDNCDIYYISSCCKAILNLGRSPQTGKEIKKTFTGQTEDEALYKLYQFKVTKYAKSCRTVPSGTVQKPRFYAGLSPTVPFPSLKPPSAWALKSRTPLWGGGVF